MLRSGRICWQQTVPVRVGTAAWLATVLLVAGCAGPRVPPADAGPLAHCEAFIADLDRRVALAGVNDAQTTRIPGFPALRINRMLADEAQRLPDDNAFAQWATALQRLGRQGHLIELSNLPADARTSLARRRVAQDHDGLAERLEECSARLLAETLASTRAREQLLAAAHVPDDYSTFRRVAGLYYFTAIPVTGGINRWHRDSREAHQASSPSRETVGEPVRFEPPPAPRLTPAEVARALRQAADNPLGIPHPAPAVREALFDTFAPHWEVDVVDANDRIGRPQWSAGARRPHVDVTTPEVFRHISHARWQGDTLLQLNYVVWFPARPKTSVFDPLGGHMDGLVWRVTLAPDGRPLMYDTIHTCGCYHAFYPARELEHKISGPWYEGAFVPVKEPLVADGAPVILRVTHRSHHIEGVGISPAPHASGVPHGWAEYDELRSLRAGDRRRSLFDAEGFVPYTHRGERYFFWPLGVVNPGAMRQWGRHATAFVGRRHFDDADILERHFREKP